MKYYEIWKTDLQNLRNTKESNDIKKTTTRDLKNTLKKYKKSQGISWNSMTYYEILRTMKKI